MSISVQLDVAVAIRRTSDEGESTIRPDEFDCQTLSSHSRRSWGIARLFIALRRKGKLCGSGWVQWREQSRRQGEEFSMPDGHSLVLRRESFSNLVRTILARLTASRRQL